MRMLGGWRTRQDVSLNLHMMELHRLHERAMPYESTRPRGLADREYYVRAHNLLTAIPLRTLHEASAVGALQDARNQFKVDRRNYAITREDAAPGWDWKHQEELLDKIVWGGDAVTVHGVRMLRQNLARRYRDGQKRALILSVSPRKELGAFLAILDRGLAGVSQ
jgi:hypothetical protein